MNSFLSYGSWALLATAIASWALVVYAGMYVLDQALVRAESITSSEQQMSRVAHNERMKALATETADERKRLEDLAATDITSIVTTLERVGPAAQVSVQISDASVEGSGTHIVDGVRLHAVAFIVSAEGSFANVVKAAKLFEQLPLPASLVQVEIAKGGDITKNTWRMTGRIRVYTTAPVTI